jgi:protein PhnA
MAKGYDQNKERLQTLSLFGKDLTRRARSSCELCQTSGVPLSIHEVAPVPKDPDLDHCIFICSDCNNSLNTGKHPEPKRWRCLGNTIWSEIPAVQVAAIRILRQIAPTEPWATEILEMATPEPEVEDWLTK